jgi:hypothetical protein
MGDRVGLGYRGTPGKEVECRRGSSLETRRLAAKPKKHWIAGPAIAIVLAVACSPAVENRPRSDRGDPTARLGQAKINFRNPEMAARYQAAKTAPRSFEPVYIYAKAVADASLASLADGSCPSCGEGAVRYKQRSELEPHYWPIIEDALAMLEVLSNVKELDAEQMAQVVATRGRLLWLAGRSNEELALIDEYARAHPSAAAVIRRRLELLRADGDTVSMESQCARSRAKAESASDASRVDLLTACVALNPSNKEGRSDLLDFPKYLPNPTPAEDALYRGNLVQRCVDRVGDAEKRCADACACEDKNPGEKPTAKCKRACGACRTDAADKLNLCKKVGEAPPVPRQKAASASSPGPTVAPASGRRPGGASARQKKIADPAPDAPKMEL